MITFIDELGKEVEYEKLLSFKVDNKVYFVFTDNVLNEENKQNVYCYFIKLEDKENKFYPVTGDELEMVKNIYDKVKGEE